jgi:hypothetical protein
MERSGGKRVEGGSCEVVVMEILSDDDIDFVVAGGAGGRPIKEWNSNQWRLDNRIKYDGTLVERILSYPTASRPF